MKNLYESFVSARDHEERGLTEKTKNSDRPRTGNTVHVFGYNITEDIIRLEYSKERHCPRNNLTPSNPVNDCPRLQGRLRAATRVQDHQREHGGGEKHRIRHLRQAGGRRGRHQPAQRLVTLQGVTSTQPNWQRARELVLCRFLKNRNCELQALLQFERGIDLRGIYSFDGIDSH